MAMKHGHENWKMYHMEDTTTETEQNKKIKYKAKQKKNGRKT
jgi:hypothetical protein